MFKTFITILLNTLAPVVLYELCVIFFYFFILGTDTWSHVHEVAWSQDLAIMLIVFSLSILCYGIWRKFIKPLPEKAVEKYRHPHEIKDWPYDHDLFI